MRQVILIGAWLLLVVGFALGNAQPASACVNWCPEPRCGMDRLPDGSCPLWIHDCCDNGAGGEICPAGYYGCNREGGCCPIGEGNTPPPPQRECWNGVVNCPAGYWLDTWQTRKKIPN